MICYMNCCRCEGLKYIEPFWGMFIIHNIIIIY